MSARPSGSPASAAAASRTARRGILGVVEHQQRRSVARARPRRRSPDAVGDFATAGVEDRDALAPTSAASSATSRVLPIPDGPQTITQTTRPRAPAPSACAASEARARARRAAASRPRAATGSSTIGGGASRRGSWARICSCRRFSSGPGSTPDLFDQGLARLAVGVERLGLAAVAVEGEHPLRVQALAERLLGDRGARRPARSPRRGARRRESASIASSIARR